MTQIKIFKSNNFILNVKTKTFEIMHNFRCGQQYKNIYSYNYHIITLFLLSVSAGHKDTVDE